MLRKNLSWLEEAVFYEIYPQTFSDSNGDGIGDIPGIIERLDYIQSLGVNAVWLNPCFDSPFDDAGYDVRDYYKVAARYGTNEDLARLFNEAQARGIRILLDLVPGHTSIENTWFQASCQHERNEYSDWFIWTNSVWDSIPPGLAQVNGYAERNGNYITNFFHFQPALNFGFANPDPRYPWQQSVDSPGPQAVRKEMRKIMKYWLEMGASGFRVDMASSLIKNDFRHKETGRLWGEIREWLDESYPEACLISEWSFPNEAIPCGFHIDFYIHFGVPGYNALLRRPYGNRPGQDPYGWSYFDRNGRGNIFTFLDDYLPHYETTKDLGYISIPTGNHDISPRLSQGRNDQDLTVVFAFLLSMPGVPKIYYGDEIGMRSITGLPSKEGGYERTASRTPMQWDASVNAGFSTAEPNQLYLPIDPASDRPTVTGQDQDPRSLLNTVRRLVALRKEHPALRNSGAFKVLHAQADQSLFVYQRQGGSETIIVAINPAEAAASAIIALDESSGTPEVLYGPENVFKLQGGGWQVKLPGCSAAIYKLS